jgi:indolepyruvate decarboxylase
VPGNHLGPFLPEVVAAKVKWVGNCNEINAGYAAEGYARVRGMGAVAVTYGVGALSVLQPAGGAYVEEIPLIVITGAPTYEQWLNLRAIGLLTSHMSPVTRANVDAFRQVTVDAQVITSSRMAPVQIDCALSACITERRPVYLEVWENVWSGECDAPVGRIEPRERPTTAANRRMLADAVSAAVELIERLGSPILWGGEEIGRFRLRAEFESLVDATGIPFCTTIGGKSVVSEDHPLFRRLQRQGEPAGGAQGLQGRGEVPHRPRLVADVQEPGRHPLGGRRLDHGRAPGRQRGPALLPRRQAGRVHHRAP